MGARRISRILKGPKKPRPKSLKTMASRGAKRRK